MSSDGTQKFALEQKVMLVPKLAPYMEGKEKPKKEADQSRLVGTGLTSNWTYIWGLSWAAARQVDLHTHPPES